ncbi:MAG: hypothetical protein PHY80_02685 [Rickettsiales bacterium]|nr:hypothetical protein [Rickettsiales bacterium]
MKTTDSIGALWKKEKNKDGKTTEFFSGKIKDVLVFVFENKEKADDNDVDYKIMQAENSEDNESESKLICTGELWEKVSKEKTDKKSETFYVGNFRGEDIVVFKNSYKTEDKHPELVVFLDLPKETEKK